LGFHWRDNVTEYKYSKRIAELSKIVVRQFNIAQAETNEWFGTQTAISMTRPHKLTCPEIG